MNIKTITYAQYNKQINRYNRLRTQGLKPIIKKNLVKISLGVICLGIAIFPNGLGVVFFPFNFLRKMQKEKDAHKNIKQHTKK